MMLVLTGSGRERTEAEFAALVGRAGYRVNRVLPDAGDRGAGARRDVDGRIRCAGSIAHLFTFRGQCPPAPLTLRPREREERVVSAAVATGRPALQRARRRGRPAPTLAGPSAQSSSPTRRWPPRSSAVGDEVGWSKSDPPTTAIAHGIGRSPSMARYRSRASRDRWRTPQRSARGEVAARGEVELHERPRRERAGVEVGQHHLEEAGLEDRDARSDPVLRREVERVADVGERVRVHELHRRGQPVGSGAAEVHRSRDRRRRRGRGPPTRGRRRGRTARPRSNRTRWSGRAARRVGRSRIAPEAFGVAAGQLGDRRAEVVGVGVHDRRAGVDARDGIGGELVGAHRHDRVVAAAS